MGPYYDHQVGRFEPPAARDDVVLLARARRARAEATRNLFRALYSGLRSMAVGIVALVRCAGYGAAKMPPPGSYRIGTPARLTGGCK